MRKLILVIALLLLLPQPAHAQEENLRLYVGDPLVPYQANRILLTSPADGVVTLHIGSRAVDWLIAQDLPVVAGRNEILYNGLFTNDEPLHKGNFTLTAQVRSALGDWQTQIKVQAKSPAPYLQYVLPRSDRLYLKGGVWQADFYHTTGLRPRVTIQKAGQDTSREIAFQRDPKNPLVFTWDGTIKRKPVEPGNYTLVVTARDPNSPRYEFPLEVLNQAPPRYELSVTPPGNFLPESTQDADIWQALTAPITVVRGRQIVREKILAEPHDKAQVLGLVSSGTAGLKVLELQDGYARVGAWRLQDGGYMEGYVKQDRLHTFLPNQRWGLVLDKATQTLTVYHDGQPIGSTRTSTGLMLAKAPQQESRAGAFTLGERLPFFDNLGYRYRYAVRVDGRNLMHQLGHPTNTVMNFDVEDAVMGQKASHGCLRMDRFPGEGGINAFWLWTNIPSDTKMLVLDDKPQRHARMVELGLSPAD